MTKTAAQSGARWPLQVLPFGKKKKEKKKRGFKRGMEECTSCAEVSEPNWGEGAGGSGGSWGKAEALFWWVTVLVGWARVWLKWCCLSLGCVRALADPSLTIAVNRHSNRALKSPPASCCFLISLLADSISLGFSSQESSPGFLVPLWFWFRAFQSSVAVSSVSFFIYMCFFPGNAKVTPCF